MVFLATDTERCPMVNPNARRARLARCLVELLLLYFPAARAGGESPPLPHTAGYKATHLLGPIVIRRCD